MYFTDIHTHKAPFESGVVRIKNLLQSDFHDALKNVVDKPPLEYASTAYFSAGLHPWFLTKENVAAHFEQLQLILRKPAVIALGECGLDALRGENLTFQRTAFERQIDLAEQIGKPVVIHCVRAFNEIIEIKKKLNPNVPLIVHGFNKNERVLESLLENGFFISVGAHLLNAVNNGEIAIKRVPLKRLFFETDDAASPIQGIFEKAADILNVSINDLKSGIYENFNTVFKTFKQLNESN